MHSLANSEDASSDCSKRHSCDCYWRNERIFCAASGGEQGSTVAAPIPLKYWGKNFEAEENFYTCVLNTRCMNFFLLCLINDHAKCNKGSLIFSPPPPSRGETHYVTEIFSPLFFKLDISFPIPFILSYLDSLRIDVCWPRMTLKALVNSTGCWREHAVPHVLFNIPCLQYSDTKCQLWYFLHLGYYFVIVSFCQWLIPFLLI